MRKKVGCKRIILYICEGHSCMVVGGASEPYNQTFKVYTRRGKVNTHVERYNSITGVGLGLGLIRIRVGL